jgi:hypothetical protein
MQSTAEELHGTTSPINSPGETAEPFAERLRGVLQRRLGVQKYTVNRRRQGAQRTNRGQSKKDEQKGVLSQILTLLLDPEALQKVLHQVRSPKIKRKGTGHG